MKKMLSVSVFSLGLAFAGNAFAGFQGPGLDPTTVAKALDMGDEAAVVLVGQIEKSLGNEKYQFKDATGTIVVEIDDEDWRGVNVKPEDTIIIRGEVDKELLKTEIDVDSVELKK